MCGFLRALLGGPAVSVEVVAPRPGEFVPTFEWKPVVGTSVPPHTAMRPRALVQDPWSCQRSKRRCQR